MAGGSGAQRVPNAPEVPVGEQSGWWQHPKARARGSSLGTARDVGLEGLGSEQQSVQQGELVWVVMHLHPCSRVFSHAWRCPFLGVCFRGKGLGMLSWGEALGSFLGLSRGAQGQTSLQIPLTPPAPCHRHCLGLCHQAVPAASPHPAGRAVLPSQPPPVLSDSVL